ncbi:MAG TPA: diacylglycerol kinase family protein [Flavobacteriales bacterium]
MQSFVYAFSGLKALLATEQNFKIHISIACIVCVAAWLLGFNQTQWMILVWTIGGVLTVEAVNTAVERLADVLSPHYDERIKIVKDVMAAAVLIMACVACVIGCFLFIPKLI